MVDSIGRIRRSELMRRVRQKNTEPEIRVRSELHRRGLRFRLHDPSLPGSPDVILPRFQVAVFVHGCFWHRHGCSYSTTPRSNTRFWAAKFQANVARDKKKTSELRRLGWRVFTVWQCELHKANASSRLDALVAKIKQVQKRRRSRVARLGQN